MTNIEYQLVKCKFCGSNNLRKDGKSFNGSQMYKCKDCGRSFSSGDNNKKSKVVIDGKCPHCGSKNLKYRGWNPSGSRRYECKDCGKCSSGESFDISRKIPFTECPHCHSDKIILNGFLSDGRTRRYRCKSCGRWFSNKTVVHEKSGINCVKCGSDNTYHYGTTEKGKPIYKCKDCGKRFVENPENMYKKHEIVCPKCGKIGAKKDGNSGLANGGYKQYYKCLACGHRYTLNPTNLTSLDKERIIEMYKQGVPVSHLAEQFNISEREIRRKTQDIPNPIQEKKKELKQEMINEVLHGKPVKETAIKYGDAPRSLSKFMIDEYSKETITKEQKETIIKFGIFCSVPINYLAEYVPCSEYMCKKVIEEYWEKKKNEKEQ